MKTITLILLGLITILTVTPAMRAEKTEPPLPIPDFMTPTQVAVWQQERIARAHAAQTAEAAKVAKASAPSAFYTGKPYLAESGTYSFLARQYNPEMARWTTVDPSGFPDGANNRVYVPNPIDEFDSRGAMVSMIYNIMAETLQITNNDNNKQYTFSFTSGDNNPMDENQLGGPIP